jgi:hypothetical protein
VISPPPASGAVALGAVLLGAACSQPVPLEAGRVALARSVIDEVSEMQLMSNVAELIESHLGDAPLPCSQSDRQSDPRFCHLTNGMTRAVVRDRFAAAGLRVTVSEQPMGPYPTANVVGELPGAARAEEVVLIGAHMDAFYAGADDNGSGLAVVLELARVFAGRSFNRTIRFVAFDLEEQGLVGSTRYVEAGGGRVEAALILDCVGYYDARPRSQKSLPGLPAPSQGDFLAIIGNAASAAEAAQVARLNGELALIPLVTVVAPGPGIYPAIGDLLRSDHAPFWSVGAPTLFFTDTANLRNPNYHQATDTIDTLNPSSFARAARLAAATLAYWADER